MKITLSIIALSLCVVASARSLELDAQSAVFHTDVTYFEPGPKKSKKSNRANKRRKRKCQKAARQNYAG